MPSLWGMTTSTATSPSSASLHWTFGDRLRKIRTQRDVNLGQDEFAAIIGVAKSTLASWERTGAEPAMSTATRVAERVEERFGVPAAWTLGMHPTVAYPPRLPHRHQPFQPAA